MKHGQLRQRVTIEQYVEAQDSAGQPIKMWQLFAQRKANIEPIDPLRTPVFRADQRFEPGTAKITLRYLPGVDQTMRVLYLPPGAAIETVYEIIDAADKGTRHRETVLMCRTGINDNG